MIECSRFSFYCYLNKTNCTIFNGETKRKIVTRWRNVIQLISWRLIVIRDGVSCICMKWKRRSRVREIKAYSMNMCACVTRYKRANPTTTAKHMIVSVWVLLLNNRSEVNVKQRYFRSHDERETAQVIRLCVRICVYAKWLDSNVALRFSSVRCVMPRKRDLKIAINAKRI